MLLTFGMLFSLAIQLPYSYETIQYNADTFWKGLQSESGQQMGYAIL